MYPVASCLCLSFEGLSCSLRLSSKLAWGVQEVKIEFTRILAGSGRQGLAQAIGSPDSCERSRLHFTLHVEDLMRGQ